MIRLVTKSWFDSNHKELKSAILPEKTNITDFFINLYPDLFLESDTEGLFYILPKFHYILYSGNLDKIFEDTDFDFSDWEITKTSDKPNPKYINNFYQFGDNYEWESHEAWEKLSLDKKLCTEASWKIENKRIGEVIEFSNKFPLYSWSKRGRLCFKEKTIFPVDINKVISKELLILNIIWTRMN